MEKGKELIVKISRLNNEADGVALYDGFVIFVPGALIDEEVKIEIVDVKKNYAVAKLLKVLIPSDKRREPICPYYDKCGGCNIMHMDNDEQLCFKSEKVKSVLKKISNIDFEIDKAYSYNNLNYRNKAIFKVDNNKIGYYEQKSNTLVDIDRCLICDDRINVVLLIIKDFISSSRDHYIKELMVRVARDEILVRVDNLNEIYEERVKELLSYVNSIYVGDRLIYGIPSINEKINDLVFDISPNSFFQINTETASKLYEYALRNVNDKNVCVDLYSGTGTITMLLAKRSRRVIGIEVVEDAIKDAENNLLLNNIDNVEFKHGRVEDLIDEIIDLNIDTLVLDPPRSGSDNKTLRALLKIKPKEIIYISCNPVTLARDYNVIKNLYTIKDIKCFDMFPNTTHVESLMVLERK